MSKSDSRPRPRTKLKRALLAIAAVAWAVLAAAGCSDGYDTLPLPPGTMLRGDMRCLTNEASQGDECSKDCSATCSGGQGRRVCTCGGGVFLQCACLPPEDWPYTEVPVAPRCDPITGQPRYLNVDLCKSEGQQCVSSTFPEQGCTCTAGKWTCGSSQGYPAGLGSCESFGSGLFAVLKGKPCDTRWDLCISRDFNQEGTSPRGCYCNYDEGATTLTWQCGGTNRWYRAP